MKSHAPIIAIDLAMRRHENFVFCPALKRRVEDRDQVRHNRHLPAVSRLLCDQNQTTFHEIDIDPSNRERLTRTQSCKATQAQERTPCDIRTRKKHPPKFLGRDIVPILRTRWRIALQAVERVERQEIVSHRSTKIDFAFRTCLHSVAAAFNDRVPPRRAFTSLPALNASQNADASAHHFSDILVSAEKFEQVLARDFVQLRRARSQVRCAHPVRLKEITKARQASAILKRRL
jgi:hypothetical protein